MKRSKINLSNYRLSTFDLGELIPVGLQEVLPGDVFQHSTSAVIRLSPMAAPIMHNITARIHHFFVPHRIAWQKAPNPPSGSWEDFISGGEANDDTQTVPQLNYGWESDGPQLGNYLGLPQLAGGTMPVNALPFVGYSMIWDEYYRDQQLQAKRQTSELNNVAYVGWEKDNFTTARPYPQLGDEITLPDMPAYADPNLIQQTVTTQGDGSLTVGNGFSPVYSTGVSVRDARIAFALQRLSEARNKYGARYTEYLRYAFGVNSSDARLQRPEYLGGGKALIQISEILQTGPETETSGGDYGVGDMYGHGISAMRSNAYRRYFEEHGYVFSLISLRPKALYTNGADRHFFKQYKNEFYQKELSVMGPQPVWAGEVYAENDQSSNREVFGWNDRYYEYQKARSQVNGDFANVLNYWHLGRIFDQRPGLNADFVECQPSKRIFNEQTRDSVWCMIRHNLIARRGINKNAVPRVI